MSTKLVVFGDLIADLSFRIQAFPLSARSMQRVDYIEMGPGGATNIAITAARLGLDVACLGEVGGDRYGRVVLEGLQREGVDVSHLIVTDEANTPVAGVVVDPGGEPAYLGYPGSLQIEDVLPEWEAEILASKAFFTEGWVETDTIAAIHTKALRIAKKGSSVTFFDPGPGNPSIDDSWMKEAIQSVDVLIGTEEEIYRFTLLDDPVDSGQRVLEMGPELVVMKRGAAGCVLFRGGDVQVSPGYPVTMLDTTGAGDSLDAAVVFGYFNDLGMKDLGILANACGAAKVRKLGTGHNVPTKEEIQQVLIQFGEDQDYLLP